MAFNPSNNLGLLEYGVKMAIKDLQCKHGVITVKMIAEHTNGSERTIHRAMKNLMDANAVERVEGSTRNGGYQYVIR